MKAYLVPVPGTVLVAYVYTVPVVSFLISLVKHTTSVRVNDAEMIA